MHSLDSTNSSETTDKLEHELDNKSHRTSINDLIHRVFTCFSLALQ